MPNRCLYAASFFEFIASDPMAVLGTLHSNYHGDSLTTTDDAWRDEIELLQKVLNPWAEEDTQIIFEYDIPRLGRRIDVVLLLRGMIFCLEFKVGMKDNLQSDIEQVMDYALDLKNFHLFSHDKIIVPILIPTKSKSYTTVFQPSVYNDDIYNQVKDYVDLIAPEKKDIVKKYNGTRLHLPLLRLHVLCMRITRLRISLATKRTKYPRTPQSIIFCKLSSRARNIRRKVSVL